MKKIIIAVLVLIAFAFANEKTFTLKQGEALMLFNALESSKRALPYSESISAKEASTTLAAIDSIEKVLVRQDTTKNK